ncbi:MerR family transcriptional regulator [Lacrimispora sp.]|uniref:MerR family transcriptional regulator n=1 Tax=Lacrimispora sp. TaxID=2719234 RepID=UPI00345FDA2A
MYTMKQVCEQTGMPYETLKYYCNEGLIPNVKRSSNNYRMFDDHDVKWISSLSCLKNCGMGIAEMKAYLALCIEGEPSIPQRKIMLEKRRKDLELKMQELQAAIDYINWKQNFYDDVLSGKTKYYSNLINVDGEE